MHKSWKRRIAGNYNPYKAWNVSLLAVISSLLASPDDPFNPYVDQAVLFKCMSNYMAVNTWTKTYTITNSLINKFEENNTKTVSKLKNHFHEYCII